MMTFRHGKRTTLDKTQKCGELPRAFPGDRATQGCDPSTGKRKGFYAKTRAASAGFFMPGGEAKRSRWAGRESLFKKAKILAGGMSAKREGGAAMSRPLCHGTMEKNASASEAVALPL